MGRLSRRGQEDSDRKAAGLCRELIKWWAARWSFAGVEPTNNVAERALRPAVLQRKGSFGSYRARGSRFPPKVRLHPAWCRRQLARRFAERLLTVVASCRQQGRNLLDFLLAAGEVALRGSLPSLLPAR